MHNYRMESKLPIASVVPDIIIVEPVVDSQLEHVVGSRIAPNVENVTVNELASILCCMALIAMFYILIMFPKSIN